jgi:hypothetical protein
LPWAYLIAQTAGTAYFRRQARVSIVGQANRSDWTKRRASAATAAQIVVL